MCWQRQHQCANKSEVIDENLRRLESECESVQVGSSSFMSALDVLAACPGAVTSKQTWERAVGSSCCSTTESQINKISYTTMSADVPLAGVEDSNQTKTLVALISDFPLANGSSVPNSR